MSELPVYLNFVLALAFVLGLIGVAAWLARRFGLAGRLAHRAGPSHRLAVVEVMPLDTRRKLVLLRRDESEYLVLLGPARELLLEGALPRRAGVEGAAAE